MKISVYVLAIFSFFSIAQSHSINKITNNNDESAIKSTTRFAETNNIFDNIKPNSCLHSSMQFNIEEFAQLINLVSVNKPNLIIYEVLNKQYKVELSNTLDFNIFENSKFKSIAIDKILDSSDCMAHLLSGFNDGCNIDHRAKIQLLLNSGMLIGYVHFTPMDTNYLKPSDSILKITRKDSGDLAFK